MRARWYVLCYVADIDELATSVVGGKLGMTDA